MEAVNKLLSNREEWTTDIGWILDEPHKDYAKWSKSDTRDHILYDSTDTPRKGRFIEAESGWVVTWGWLVGMGINCKSTRGILLRGSKNTLKFIYGDGKVTLATSVKLLKVIDLYTEMGQFNDI